MADLIDVANVADNDISHNRFYGAFDVVTALTTPCPALAESLRLAAKRAIQVNASRRTCLFRQFTARSRAAIADERTSSIGSAA